MSYGNNFVEVSSRKLLQMTCRYDTREYCLGMSSTSDFWEPFGKYFMRMPFNLGVTSMSKNNLNA